MIRSGGRASALTRREALARLLVGSWMVLAACRQPVRPDHLSGVIVDVQAASFTLVQTFSLRTDAGETHEFVVEGNIGITPGHMREHMLLGEPVMVFIKYADGLQIATRVDDVPVAQPDGSQGTASPPAAAP